MTTSSLEKSLTILKDVQARLSNALTIQPKNLSQVCIQLKDIKVRPYQQLHVKSIKSIPSQPSSYAPPPHKPSSKQSPSSSTITQLKSQNKELKKYIQLLQKLNENLRGELHKCLKKSQHPSAKPSKNVNIYYDSDHLTFMSKQLQTLKKINQFQTYELQHYKQQQHHPQPYWKYATLEPKDIYEYVTPAKIMEQRSKYLEKMDGEIPKYNGYCGCHEGRKFQTISKSKLAKEEVGHKRAKTEWRAASGGEQREREREMGSGKIGTITKKKKATR